MRSLIDSVQRSEDGCDMSKFRSFNHSIRERQKPVGSDLFET